jgi:hypothetical protein
MLAVSNGDSYPHSINSRFCCADHGLRTLHGKGRVQQQMGDGETEKGHILHDGYAPRLCLPSLY